MKIYIYNVSCFVYFMKGRSDIRFQLKKSYLARLKTVGLLPIQLV